MRRRSLWEVFPDFGKPNIERQATRSGKGVVVHAHAVGKFRQHYPILPLPTPQAGQTGMPSSDFSTMASRFMQNQTMNDDDIEYWASIADNPPYDVERTYTHAGGSLTSTHANPQGSMFPEEPDDSWRDPEEDDDALREVIRAIISLGS